jgi:hypothetical protein
MTFFSEVIIWKMAGGVAYDQAQVKNVLRTYFLKIDYYEDGVGGHFIYW